MFLFCDGALTQRANGNIRCNGNLQALSPSDLTEIILSNAPELDLNQLISVFQPSVVETFTYVLIMGITTGFTSGLVLNIVKRGRNL